MFVHYLNSQHYVLQTTFNILEKCAEKYLQDTKEYWEQKSEGIPMQFEFLRYVTQRLNPPPPPPPHNVE